MSYIREPRPQDFRSGEEYYIAQRRHEEDMRAMMQSNRSYPINPWEIDPSKLTDFKPPTRNDLVDQSLQYALEQRQKETNKKLLLLTNETDSI